VTWLLQGELLHRDSLGSEQAIRPGQLNLMTAGHGVAHAEESTRRDDHSFHGVQLWVAQPTTTRAGPPAFEHHAELPRVELAAGTGTVLVGTLGAVTSPARRDTDHVGLDLALRPGRSTIPLDPGHEHGLVVFSGAMTVDGHGVTPGHLAYLGTGRDEVDLDAERVTRALLVGGEPFPEPVLMWWNYVARERREIITAHRDWTTRAERFGHVASSLAPIDTGPPPWSHP
jgi:redox-sensitive bicupin YhaK (pirin superfamily)